MYVMISYITPFPLVIPFSLKKITVSGKMTTISRRLSKNDLEKPTRIALHKIMPMIILIPYPPRFSFVIPFSLFL
jgi:hypothetical protein